MVINKSCFVVKQIKYIYQIVGLIMMLAKSDIKFTTDQQSAIEFNQLVINRYNYNDREVFCHSFMKENNMSKKTVSVAEYLTQQINMSGKSQIEISSDVGYPKPNVITMFKQGKTRLPINKIPAFAKSLGVDPVHFLRIAMSEYMPETWEVIEACLGSSLVTEEEQKVLDIIRTVSNGLPIAPETEADAQELALLAEKWRKRSEALIAAAQERIDRERAARAAK